MKNRVQKVVIATVALLAMFMVNNVINIQAATAKSIDDLVKSAGVDSSADEYFNVSDNEMRVPDNELVQEGYNPCQTDAFMHTKTLKGIQGNPEFDHYFMNCYLETAFSYDNGTPNGVRYDYQGSTYYFTIPAGINTSTIRKCNAEGKSVSITFLLRYESGKTRLIDPEARSGGYNYYVPNFVEPEVAKEYDAFFHFLAERFSQADCHIDNWILGNEENMPAFGRTHRTSSYYGTVDADTIVRKYANYFNCVYHAVRTYTTATRVSVSVDHSWQHNDEGKGISTRAFLDLFNAIVGSGVDWHISYHAYPAILYDSRIWSVSAYTGKLMNAKDEYALFVDGANLNILTDYIKQNYGSNHRVMITEVGFSQYHGLDNQAAAFAYTYYAAKFNDLVDCMILHTANLGGRENYTFAGVAVDVFFKIDNGNPEDTDWVANVCLPLIGVDSWEKIIPGYRKIVNIEQIQAFVKRLYNSCLQRNPDEVGFNDWTNRLASGSATGGLVAKGFFFSKEFLGRNISDEDYVEMLYNVMMGRASDPVGKNSWVSLLKQGASRESVFRGFVYSVEFNHICGSYGIYVGEDTPSEPKDINAGLTAFVARLYTKALGRDYDLDGLNTWCQRISSGEWTIGRVAGPGFLHSKEFESKNLSDSEYVKVLYRTFLDREYDQTGYDYWMNKLASGVGRDDILDGFLYSQEFGELQHNYGLR